MSAVLRPVIDDIKQLVSFIFYYLDAHITVIIHRKVATPSRLVMLNKQCLELYVSYQQTKSTWWLQGDNYCIPHVSPVHGDYCTG